MVWKNEPQIRVLQIVYCNVYTKYMRCAMMPSTGRVRDAGRRAQEEGSQGQPVDHSHQQGRPRCVSRLVRHARHERCARDPSLHPRVHPVASRRGPPDRGRAGQQGEGARRMAKKAKTKELKKEVKQRAAKVARQKTKLKSARKALKKAS